MLSKSLQDSFDFFECFLSELKPEALKVRLIKGVGFMMNTISFSVVSRRLNFRCQIPRAGNFDPTSSCQKSKQKQKK